jgi:hypothetical protein
MLVVIAAILWGMYELFRRFSLIESFSSYGLPQKSEAEKLPS